MLQFHGTTIEEAHVAFNEPGLWDFFVRRDISLACILYQL